VRIVWGYGLWVMGYGLWVMGYGQGQRDHGEGGEWGLLLCMHIWCVFLCMHIYGGFYCYICIYVEVVITLERVARVSPRACSSPCIGRVIVLICYMGCMGHMRHVGFMGFMGGIYICGGFHQYIYLYVEGFIIYVYLEGHDKYLLGLGLLRHGR
jgi:hypothetical protein